MLAHSKICIDQWYLSGGGVRDCASGHPMALLPLPSSPRPYHVFSEAEGPRTPNVWVVHSRWGEG